MESFDLTYGLGKVLQLVSMCVVAVVPFVGTFGCGIYILRPLDRAARNLKMPTRFTIADSFALVTHLSIPLGYIGRLSDIRSVSRVNELILVLFGCFAAVLIWCGTVVTASRAGITDPARRLVMIGVIVPLAFVVTIVYGPLLSFLAYGTFDAKDGPSPWLYLLAVGLTILVGVCRRAVDWVLIAPTEMETHGKETFEMLS